MTFTRNKEYVAVGFEKFWGTRVLDNVIMSHIPLHPMSVPRWALGNIHGHVHTNGGPEGRYLNVSVEVINYQPLPLYRVKEMMKEKNG
jgi:calcineurin-like phosphoesterase family protein